MSSRTCSPCARRSRRSHRWPLVGACFWLFLMTLLGAELAAGERARPFPDEGYGQGEGRGQTDRGRQGTGL